VKKLQRVVLNKRGLILYLLKALCVVLAGVLVSLIVTSKASGGAPLFQAEAAPGVHLVSERYIEAHELDSRNWPRFVRMHAEAGGMRLRSYLAEHPSDNVLLRVSLDTGASISFGLTDRLVFYYGDTVAVPSTEILMALDAAEFVVLSSNREGIRLAEGMDANGVRGHMLVARFPLGSIAPSGRGITRPDSVALVREGGESDETLVRGDRDAARIAARSDGDGRHQR